MSLGIVQLAPLLQSLTAVSVLAGAEVSSQG